MSRMYLRFGIAEPFILQSSAKGIREESEKCR